MDMTKDIQACRAFTGNTRMPEDFKDYWEQKLSGIRESVSIRNREICFSTDDIEYASVTYGIKDGREIQAAFLRPMNTKPRAVVLDFHDNERTARGFFYLSRYVAMGCSVLAPGRLEFNRSEQLVNGADCSPEALTYGQTYVDAVTAVAAAEKLCGELPVYAYGEGSGAAGAIAAAAFGGVRKCAVLNPMPADFRTVADLGYASGFYEPLKDYFRACDPTHSGEERFFRNLDYIDTVNFASLLEGKLLLGTSMLDEVTPAAAQFGLFNRAGGEKKHSVFPKFTHERVNFFENDALNFFLEER